jgi:hypothetical protein
MSGQIQSLILCFAAGSVFLGMALWVRFRGPIGILKNVDWSRVSDPQGLGIFISLMLTLMSADFMVFGVYSFYASPDEVAQTGHYVFVTVLLLLAIAIWIGQVRYQDKPHSTKSNDRR